MERRILAGNRYAPLAREDTDQGHGHPDVLYLSEMKSHGAPSLWIETMLISKNQKAATQALMDGRATGIFMHPHFIEMHRIRTQKTPTPIPVNMVQNTEFKGGPITKFAKLKLQVLGEGEGMHTELAKFYIAEIGKEDVILGTDWLLEHNPEVDWHAYRLHFT